MSKTYFKAIHSNGTTHLRASISGRPYIYAVAGPRLGGIAFSSSRSRAESDAKTTGNGYEAVPAIEISATEYAALDKANKVFCSVVFRGKKYTHADNIDRTPAEFALGVYRAPREIRIDLTPEHHKGYHEKHPEGFYIQKDSGYQSVYFGSRQYVDSCKPQNYDQVEIIPVTRIKST